MFENKLIKKRQYKCRICKLRTKYDTCLVLMKKYGCLADVYQRAIDVKRKCPVGKW